MLERDALALHLHSADYLETFATFLLKILKYVDYQKLFYNHLSITK